MEAERLVDYSNYTAFISYRRDGGEGNARLLHEKLKQAGVAAFYDVDSLRNGRFDINLLNSIEDCDNFILILSKDALNWKRLHKRGDFVRREIEYALKHKKNIIPVMMDGFDWKSVKWLPESMSVLPLYNGIKLESSYNSNLFDAFIKNLLNMLVGPGEPIVDLPVPPPVKWKKYAAIGAGAAVVIAAVLFLLLKNGGSVLEPVPTEAPAPAAADASATKPLYVFADEGSSENQYILPVKIGMTSSVYVNDIDMGCTDQPFTGTTCIRAHVDTVQDTWGGWMLLNGYMPEDGSGITINDGTTSGQGVNLTDMTELRFWARGGKGGEKVEFFCFGFGYDEKKVPQYAYNDSAFKQTIGTVELSDQWTEYVIAIPDGLDLGNISCGFGFVCAGAENGLSENTFYMDEIRYCSK